MVFRLNHAKNRKSSKENYRRLMMNAKFMLNFTRLNKTLKMKNCQRAKNRIKRLPSKVIKELLPKLISKISVNKTTT